MPPFESSTFTLIVWAVIGYGLGSVPFGLLLTRAMGLGNLRDIGSGNIGATNVLRTGNKGAAALTLGLDAAKGALAVLLARAFAPEDAVQLAGLAAFMGHCFPVWLGFKGGKGVATFLGLWLALAWPVGIACCATWLAIFAISRTSSLSALFAAGSSSIWALFLGYGPTIILAFALTALIYVRHSENIARLRAGEEPKVGQNR